MRETNSPILEINNYLCVYLSIHSPNFLTAIISQTFSHKQSDVLRLSEEMFTGNTPSSQNSSL